MRQATFKQQNHNIMIFKFWKGNQVNGLFHMTGEEVRKAYLNWLVHKGPEWVESNYHIAEAAFVADPEGLNSVTEQMPILADILSPMTKSYVETF